MCYCYNKNVKNNNLYFANTFSKNYIELNSKRTQAVPNLQHTIILPSELSYKWGRHWKSQMKHFVASIQMSSYLLYDFIRLHIA